MQRNKRKRIDGIDRMDLILMLPIFIINNIKYNAQILIFIFY